MRYTVVLTPEPDGSAVNVAVPAMPGVHTWGRTAEEALASAREAIMLHLEGYAERGLPAPRDRHPRGGRPPAATTAAQRQPTRAGKGSRFGRQRQTGLLGAQGPTVTTVEVNQLVGA